jgi:DNA-binding transcriptional LysR family regulator
MSKNLLSTSGLSFERLRAFLEIAEARGISRAARGNPNRQSQLSRQLAELEAFFGTPLVSRGRGVAFSLTETGRRLKAIAAQQFTALEELKQQPVRGALTIRIGAGEILLTWLVIPALATVPSLPENLRLSLLNRRSVDIIAGVSDGTLEVGLIHREPPPVGLRWVPLGTITRVLVRPVALNRFAKGTMPLAVMEEAGRDEHSSGPQLTVSGKPTFFCSSYHQMRDLVNRGYCAAVLPRFMVQDFSPHDFHSDPLRQAKADWRLQVLVNPKLIEHRPVAAKLVNELTGAFRSILTGPRTE